MARPGNQHCAGCIGTLSFPIRTVCTNYEFCLCCTQIIRRPVTVCLIVSVQSQFVPSCPKL